MGGIATGSYSRVSVFGLGMPTDAPTLEQEISPTENNVTVGANKGVKRWLVMGVALLVVLHILGR